MNPLLTYLTSASIGLVAALTLTPVAIRVARHQGLMDLPDARKVHDAPIPRTGGLAIAGAWLLAILITAAVFGIDDRDPTQLLAVAVGAAFITLVGFADDIWNLPSQHKLIALVAAGTAVWGAGLGVDPIVFGNGFRIDLGWFDWLATIFWIVGVSVSINFIDGLDGLAGGIVAIAAGALAIALMAVGAVVEGALVLTLTACLVGFLWFNVHPARVFMGDSGSLFIGFTFACCCLVANQRVGAMKGILVPMLALSVPILDTASTLIRRSILQRRSVFAAERGHIHHRLTDEVGLRHPHAVLVLWGLTAAAAGVGLLSLLNDGWSTAAGASLVIPLHVLFFRVVGSFRTRNVVEAIRRNRALERETRRYRRAFEEMQIRFLKATSFQAWWNCVCEAAQRFDCTRVELAVTRRDGTPTTLRWSSPGTGDDEPVPPECLTAAVPIPQRRSTEPLKAQVTVCPGRFLESAGGRIALFSRLMAEHSLVHLPDQTRKARKSRLHHAAGDANGAANGSTNGHANGSLNGHANGNGRGLRPPVLPAGVRVAIVHDFLYCYGGAERVLEQMLEVFPDADLFSLFDFVPPAERGFLHNKPVTTTFLQKLPMASKRHRLYLPLMPLAIEQLDVSAYDVVISSSYCVAKGVITRPDQLHICYCHSPARFAWDLQTQYLGQSGLTRGLRSMAARAILHYIRTWDTRSANGVDVFVTNSDFVGRRVEKVYRREAQTIYPPVDVESMELGLTKEEFYLTVSRMVPYKRIDLIVEAFSKMPDRKLIVIGNGPEFEKIKAKAGPNVRLVGHVTFERLKTYMQLAKAFVFAAEEDFGIVPVEAQACGTPVIAYGRGGVTESVVDRKTGVFFPEQTVESLVEAVEEFEGLEVEDAEGIRKHAMSFSSERFRRVFGEFIAAHWQAFERRQLQHTPRGRRSTPRGVDRALETPVARVRPEDDASSLPLDPEAAVKPAATP